MPLLDQKIRIAVLGLRGFPGVQGGVEKHCQELYPRLTRYNCEITVLARKGYVEENPYVYRGVKIIPLWAPRMKALEAICHTIVGLGWLAGHRREYDVVHLHAIGPSLLTPLARWLGFRVLVTNHGPDYDRQKWGALARSMLRLGEFLGTRYAHRVIAVSKHIKAQLWTKYGKAAQYIPNGVNIPEKVSTRQALNDFGLEPGRYILAVGRLVPEKGFHDLLEAFAEIGSGWKLAIVGHADHQGRYSKTLIQRAKQINNVVMTGFQKGRGLAELYSNAGLFVLPSYHEGLPIVALEAMSYNLPILLSDIPANQEVAFSGETFPLGNKEVLVRKLQAFLDNPSAIASPQLLREKAAHLKTEFNWDVIAQQTFILYQTVFPL